MKKHLRVIAILTSIIVLLSCGEKWTCQSRGKTLFSVSESGKLGSADEGCSCSEVRAFELKVLGEVDGAALKRDFGCD